MKTATANNPVLPLNRKAYEFSSLRILHVYTGPNNPDKNGHKKPNLTETYVVAGRTRRWYVVVVVPRRVVVLMMWSNG